MTETDRQVNIRKSRKVSIISIMTALALIGNYSLIFIPNVELGSTILFMTGVIFGLEIALPCVLIMSFIFAGFNPWGAFIPQIWITQVVGWVYMVVAAHLIRRNREFVDSIDSLELAVAGIVTTIVFDLVTNMGYSIAFSVPYSVALIGGLPFMMIHIISNAVLFTGAIPIILKTIKTHFASQIWDMNFAYEQNG